MKTVSIHGSCVNRDLLNSKFIHDHNLHFKLINFQNQPSIISTMAAKPHYDKSILAGISPGNALQTISGDLDKKFLADLIGKPTDVLLMDNISETRFGVHCFSNTFVTYNFWLAKGSRYEELLLSCKKYNMHTDSEKHLDLYGSALASLNEVLQKMDSPPVIILNMAKFIDYKREIDGKIVKAWDSRDMNDYKDKLDAMFLEKISSAKVINQNISYEVSPHDHPWGAAQVHFEKEFYQDAFEQLKAAAGSVVVSQ